MTSDQPIKNDDPGSTIDTEIAELLDRYLQQREQGTAPSREEWLGQHPEYADRLGQCLDAAELFDNAVTAEFDLPQGSASSVVDAGTPISIGDFEILGELGRGGMGVVYEAREKSLDRIVALKVMRFGIVDPKALDRFRREAETAGALHHTNIVPVYATGREGDTSWYAMQRIAGESLATRLSQAKQQGRGIDLESILDVGIQAADALGHAHQRDVVHRDVKPANLILDSESRVWLTDFGLARRLVDAGATATGAILGTPRYMSPEQADLATTDVDHRSDIYSLGATLYEMATGKPPFAGDDPFQLISRIRYEDPKPIRSLRPELPRDVEVVLGKAMEKDPQRRYQSAEAFADDLRAIRDDHPIQARPLSLFEMTLRTARKHRGRVRTIAAAMIVTTALIGILLVGFAQWKQSRLGSFLVRAGGGPYQATIVPRGETTLSGSALAITLPMQTPQTLAVGDHEIRVSPQGGWSRRYQLPIAKGFSSEYRITGSPPIAEEISIVGAITTAFAGEASASILWRKDGIAKRINWQENAKQDRRAPLGTGWQLDVSAIETVITDLGSNGIATPRESIKVNFANTERVANYDRGHLLLDDNPLLNQGGQDLRTRIDLDADGRADTVFSAVDSQAILAVDAEGKPLWSRGFTFAGDSFRTELHHPFSRSQEIPFPGVICVRDIGDQDGDSIPDLMLVLAHFTMPNPTEICVVIASGKDGDPIHWIFDQCKAVQNKFWPADAIFHLARHEYRSNSSLSFASDSVHRSGQRMINDFTVRTRSNSSPVRIPLASPPAIYHHDSGLVSALLIGDRCRVSHWSEEQVDDVSIKLPFVPARAPEIATTSDGPLLVFHDHDGSTIINQRFSGTRVVAYSLSGKLKWQHAMEHIEWRDAIDRNHADWPLAADLNGDGNDEVVLPRSRYLNGVELGIQTINASSGKMIWSPQRPYTAFQSAGDCISRIAVTDDIDNDGWCEIATATISGESIEHADGSEIHRAFVYLDWISGRTGQRLSWARHSVPIIGDQPRVAQIDAIRGDLYHAAPGTIEIDLIAGDQTLDVMAATSVVRFHPSHVDAVSVAEGLDVCPTPADTESRIRVYRKRGGPFGIGEDVLMLMKTPNHSASRLGDSFPLASWVGTKNQSLLATSATNPPRLAVIHSNDQTTRWTKHYPETDRIHTHLIRQPDGTIDFLIQQPVERVPAEFIDGDSGQTLCQIDGLLGGKVVWSDLSDGIEKALLVSNGRDTRPISGIGNRDDGFQMSLVDLRTGRIRWTQRFLFDAARHNTPEYFNHLRRTDINQDGVLDIIGTHAQNEELLLVAWDGSDGAMLWQKTVHQRAQDTRYWLPFVTTEIQGRPHLVYFGKTTAKDALPQLVLCDAKGETVATKALRYDERIPQVDAEYSHRYFAMEAIKSQDGQPAIATVYTVGGKYTCEIFQLTENSIIADRAIQDPIKHSYAESMWFRDVDGDGKAERLLISRVTPQNPNGTTDSLPPPGLLIRCFEIFEEEHRFKIELPGTNSLSQTLWKQDHDHLVSWLFVDNDQVVAVDWTRGTVLDQRTRFPLEWENLPVLCFAEGTSLTIASPSLDGLEFERVGQPEQRSQNSFVAHGELDPRRMRNPFDSIGGNVSPLSILWTLVRGAFALGILVVIPIWYFWGSLHSRRWSLSWMLLLPLIVGGWIVTWQSNWVHEPNLILNLANGLTLWLSVMAVRQAIKSPFDRSGYSVRLMILVGFPVVFAAFILVTRLQVKDPNLHYTYDYSSIARVALISFTLVIQIYWVLRVIGTSGGWISSRLRKQVVA